MARLSAAMARCDVMLVVLALLATSRTAHAWPSRLSASRGITAGNIIMGKTVQESSAGSVSGLVRGVLIGDVQNVVRV